MEQNTCHKAAQRTLTDLSLRRTKEMNVKRILLAALPALLVVNCGCLFFYGHSRGTPVDTMLLERLLPGETTAFEATELIGLPDDIVAFHEGMIYRYYYTKANTFIFLIFGRTDEQKDQIDLLIDERGVIVDKPSQFKAKDTAWSFWPFGR